MLVVWVSRVLSACCAYIRGELEKASLKKSKMPARAAADVLLHILCTGFLRISSHS